MLPLYLRTNMALHWSCAAGSEGLGYYTGCCFSFSFFLFPFPRLKAENRLCHPKGESWVEAMDNQSFVRDMAVRVTSCFSPAAYRGYLLL